MSKVMYKSDASYVSCRAGVYYYTRRVPYDVRQHYASNRLSFSLRTKSNAGALRAACVGKQRVYLLLSLFKRVSLNIAQKWILSAHS